jgi:hypothetical protein
MRRPRLAFVVAGLVGLLIAVAAAAGSAGKGPPANPGKAKAGPNATMRWDIINADFATGTVSAGGQASARANDNSKITLTGNGTFHSNPGNSQAVTGGGTWTTYGPDGVTVTGSGTYKVTRFVSFTLAPGTPPLPHDTIGNSADNRAGLLIVKTGYSDGTNGTLTVSCHLVGTSDAVFEGVTATKGYVDYWNREAPPAPPGNANRTTFHVLHSSH